MKKLTLLLLAGVAYLMVDTSTVQAQSTTADKVTETNTNSGGSDIDRITGGGIGSGVSTGSGSAAGSSGSSGKVWVSSGNCGCHNSLGATLGVGHTSHGNGYGYGHWLYGQCLQQSIACNCPVQ
ncbi:MAG: hypothetical protein JKY33_08150 [Bacteroidia bacterium]|nr:hypothetical protein [Bacteroidia bacterium]